MLKACPKTALSKAKVNKNTHDYYITDEISEAKVKNVNRSIEKEAIVKESELSIDEIIDVLFSMGINADASKPQTCRTILSDEIDLNPKRFLSIVGDVNFSNKAFIIRCANANIITKEGAGKGYNMPLSFGDIQLGVNINDTVGYLFSGEGTKTLAVIKKAYNDFKKENK